MSTVSRAHLLDIEQAFRNLKPLITPRGSSLVITQREKSFSIPLSSPKSRVGKVR